MHTMVCQDLHCLAAILNTTHTTVRCLEYEQVKFSGAAARVIESLTCLWSGKAHGCLEREYMGRSNA